MFLFKEHKKSKLHILPFCISGAVFVSVYLILAYNNIVIENVPIKYNIITVLFFLSLLVLTSLFLKFRNSKKLFFIFSVTITAVCIAELTVNTGLLLKNNFSETDNDSISKYIDNSYDQINEINKDKGTYPYRINRTVVRGRDENNQQAHYDESFFFNYYGIGSYTSCTDSRQINLLDRLGYKNNGSCINVINDSVLSTDSLLGAKYITVKEPFNFLKPMDYSNDIYLYKNIYSFPISFKIKKNAVVNFDSFSMDTFDYQNKLFTALTGIEKNIFNRLEFTEEKTEDKRVYSIKQISLDNPVYGYFFHGNNANGLISTKGVPICTYAKWLAPSLFRIPYTGKDNNSLQIELTAKDLNAFTTANFCELDTTVLSEMSLVANANSANDIVMSNSFFSCYTEAGADEKLFTSIPYTKGWTITVNDISVEPELLYDCLMIIPLQEGNNNVVMKYNLPYLKEGIILSLSGIGAMIVYVLIYNKLRRND